MERLLRHLVFSLLVGVLIAGPISAVALVSLPPEWRGPAIPGSVLVASVLLAALARSAVDKAR
jgi:hypothetical protein